MEVGALRATFQVNTRPLSQGLKSAAKQLSAFQKRYGSATDVELAANYKGFTADLKKASRSLNAFQREIRKGATVEIRESGAKETVAALGLVKRTAEDVDGEDVIVDVSQKGAFSTIAALKAVQQAQRTAVNEFNRDATTIRNIGMMTARAGVVGLVGAIGPLTSAALAGTSALTSLAGGYGLVYAAASPTIKVLGEYSSVLNDLSVEQRRAMSAQQEAAYVQEKLAEEGINLTRTQRGVLEGVLELGETYTKSFAKATTATDKLMIKGLDLGQRVMPFLGEQAEKNVSAIGRAFENLGKSYQAPAQVTIFERFFSRLPSMTQTATQTLGSFGLGLFNILETAQPYAQDLLGWLSKVGEEFSSWTRSSSGREAIRRFLSDTVPVARDVAIGIGRISTGLFELSNSKPALEFFDQIARFFGFIGDSLPELAPVFQTLNRAAGIIDSLPKPLKDAAFQATAFYLAFKLLGGGFLLGIARGAASLAGSFAALRASQLGLLGPIAIGAIGLGALAINFGTVTDKMGPLGKGLQKLTSGFNDQNNARMIYEEGLSGLKKAFTDNSGLSSKWSGKLGDLKDRFSELGGGLIAGVTDDIGPLKNALSGLANDKDRDNKLEGIWDKLFGKDRNSDKAKQKIGEFLGWVGQRAQDKGLTTKLDSIWDKLFGENRNTDVAQAKIGTFLSTVGQRLGQTKLPNIWDKLTDDTGAIENARNRWTTFSTWLGSAVGQTKLPSIWAKLTDDTGALQNVRNRITQFGTFVSQRWTLMRTQTGMAWTQITTRISTAWGQIRTRVVSGITQVRTFLVTGWNTVRNATVQAWTQITSRVTQAWTQIRSRVMQGVNTARQSVVSGWNTIRNLTATVWNFITNLLNQAWQRIRSVVLSGVGQVRQVVQQGWQFISTNTQTAWSSVRDFVVNRITEAKNRAGEIVNSLKGAMSSAWESIKNGASSAWKAIAGVMTDPIGSAVDTIRGFLSDLVDLVNKVLNAVGLDPISVEFGGGGTTEPRRTPTGGSPQAFAQGGITDGFGRAYAKGGTVDKKRGGTSGPRDPRYHVWGEGDYHEAYLTTDPRFRADNDRYAAWYAGKTGGIYWPADTRKRAQQYLWMADRMDKGQKAGNVPLEESGTQFSEGNARYGRDMPLARTVRRTYAKGGISDTVLATVDWAHQSDGQPYAWGGSWPPTTDCSGWQNVVHMRYTGNTSPSGRSPFGSTASMTGGQMPGLGFSQGTVNPGYSVGVANGGPGGGHTAGTLAWDGGEINTETGGGAGGTMTGGSAWGATNSYFSEIWGKGTPGDLINGGGGGGSSPIPNPKQIAFEKAWDTLVKPVVDRVLSPFDDAQYVMLNAVGKIARKVPQGIYEWIDKKIPDMVGGSGGNLPDGNSPSGLTIGEALSQGGWPDSLLTEASSTVYHESGGNARAQNPSGARGLMQIMPQTASGVGADYEKLYDPVYNTTAGKKVYDQAGGWGPWVGAGQGGDYRNNKVTGYDKGGLIPGALGDPKILLAHAGEIVLPQGISKSFLDFSASLREATKLRIPEHRTEDISRQVEQRVSQARREFEQVSTEADEETKQLLRAIHEKLSDIGINGDSIDRLGGTMDNRTLKTMDSKYGQIVLKKQDSKSNRQRRGRGASN